MKIIDVHSHWGTKRGYVLQTEAELAQQRATWRSEPTYHTEQEMADYLRASGAGLPAGAGVILDHCHPRHPEDVLARIFHRNAERFFQDLRLKWT